MWFKRSYHKISPMTKKLIPHILCRSIKYMFGFGWIFLRLPFCVFLFFFFNNFFMHTFQLLGDRVYCSCIIHGAHNHFIQKKNFKNEFHDTIHTFKNYFITVFSVFNKISCIQTDSKFDFWYTNSKSNYFSISKIKQLIIKLVDTQKMN